MTPGKTRGRLVVKLRGAPKAAKQKNVSGAPPERALPCSICSINILPLWGKYPPYLPTVFAIAEVVKKIAPEERNVNRIKSKNHRCAPKEH